VLSLDDLASLKNSLDKQIGDLAGAIAELRSDLEPQTWSEEHIITMQEVFTEMMAGLSDADNNPQTQRHIFQLLNVRGIVLHENGQRQVDVTCDLGSAVLSLAYSTNLGKIGQIAERHYASPLCILPSLLCGLFAAPTR
jgi:hypothetical protein